MTPTTTRRTGWLDCSSGASGDMLLGALLGAGVPLDVVAGAVAALGVPVTVDVRPVVDAGLAAQQAVVTADEAEPPARTLSDVRALIDGADLDAAVRTLALDVFTRLARAEATVHGTDVEAVHFHEVGALDALADVVGCAAGFVHLALDAVVVSPVSLGSGRARTAHGELPVPVPAVLELLRESGLPATGGTAPFEQCTPTGAAILSAVATGSGPMPAMTVTATGVGAGTRRLPDAANVVRLVVGTSPSRAAGPASQAVVLSTNVDDLDPRIWPTVLDSLLAAGASDVWLTPILMKKGRPAHTLSVLCTTDRTRELRDLVFSQTSAIGLREQIVGKHALDREEHTVTVFRRPVRVKVALLDGVIINVQPEFEDVLAVSLATRRATKAVLAEALSAASAAGLTPGGGAPD